MKQQPFALEVLQKLNCYPYALKATEAKEIAAIVGHLKVGNPFDRVYSLQLCK
jgi:glutaminase